MESNDSEWFNLDCRSDILKIGGGRYTPDIIAQADNIPVDDNTFDEVLAHSILEHVSKRDYNRFLSEWYRVMKPNGKLIISVPDIYLVCKDLIHYIETNQSVAIKSTINLIYGEQDYKENTHLWGWTEETLTTAIRRAGFTGSIRRLKSERYPSELLMEVIK